MTDAVETIEVEIPFMGFYESIHDANLTQAVEQQVADDNGDISDEDAEKLADLDIPWRKLQAEYAKYFVEVLASELGVTLEYVTMQSPQYYNFSTDRIFANMPVEEWEKIRAEVEAWDVWPTTIRKRFTSYDGFMSFFSNDYQDEDWTRKDLEVAQTGVYLQLYIESQLGKDWEYLLEIHPEELESMGAITLDPEETSAE